MKGNKRGRKGESLCLFITFKNLRIFCVTGCIGALGFMNLITSEATIAQYSQGRLKPSSARERLCCTLLMRAKSPKTAVQGLHLLSFGTTHLIFHVLAQVHIHLYTCCIHVHVLVFQQFFSSIRVCS